MKYILAKRNRRVLQRFVRSKVLIVFDYDGTLAPIAGDAQAAIMRRRTRTLLQRLTEHYPCAVLSGRSPTKLSRFLDGVAVQWIVGNDGADNAHTSELKQRVQRWKTWLAPRLESFPEIKLKRERCALAIEYGGSPNRRRALAAIRKTVGEVGGATVEGKDRITVVPKGAPHKGLALLRLCKRAGCATAVYVADDPTDEAVFALDEPNRLLAIRVQPNFHSRSSYYLNDQREIDDFVVALLRRCEKIT